VPRPPRSREANYQPRFHSPAGRRLKRAGDRLIRVGLLTYHFVDNFGAVLQAYALRQWFLARGITAEFVDYRPSYVERGGPFDRPWNFSVWRKNATILYMRLNSLRHWFYADAAQAQSFEAFRRVNLGVNGPGLIDLTAVSDAVTQYDILVCGSDQIWNPSIQRGLDPVYFLEIPGAKHARRVAYAPSFGRPSVESRYLSELERLVQGLDALSVRENSGLDVLEAAGVPREAVRVVADPTILLGNFGSLLRNQVTGNENVFCYALRTDKVIRNVALHIALLGGNRLVSAQNRHQRWHDIGAGKRPGPVEWLEMLAGARTVVSNSFHGVAISILLNKHFLAVALPGKRAAMNARVLSLLNQVGLSERIVYGSDPMTVRRLVEQPIDWRPVNARLAKMRSDAEDYLDRQIEAVAGHRP